MKRQISGDCPEPKPTNLYFIQMGDSGPVKIGLAANPQHRLRHLQTASPYELRLLASWGIDDPLVELEIHARFESAHIRGEWFEPVPELLRYVEALA